MRGLRLRYKWIKRVKSISEVHLGRNLRGTHRGQGREYTGVCVIETKNTVVLNVKGVLKMLPKGEYRIVLVPTL